MNRGIEKVINLPRPFRKYRSQCSIKFLSAKDACYDYLLRLKYWRQPYFKYYQAVMKRRVVRDPKNAVGGKWDIMGPLQLWRLKQCGLGLENTLLEIGCGSLRGGRHFIRYLARGKYTGLDISTEAIDAGRRLLIDEQLTNKEPRLIINSDLRFRELESYQFDFIHAQSVFSHMPLRDIEECFSNLWRVMHPNSVMVASYLESKSGSVYSTRRNQDFYYPFEVLESCAARHSFVVKRAPNLMGGAVKQPIIIIRLRQGDGDAL